ncbi:BEL1-like homeodomain protein 1 [Linum perenne]
MTTYFHGGNPEIQTEGGLHTLLLMNPTYAHHYSAADTPPPHHFSGGHHHHQQHQQQQLVGIPLDPAASHHYSLYSAVDLSGAAARDLPRALHHHHHQRQQQPQGLSLTLSSHQQVSSSSGVTANCGAAVVPSAGGVLLGSKYLKAAQELIDEVVNVNVNFNGGAGNSKTEALKKGNDSNAVTKAESAASGDAKLSPELTSAERQEVQMRKGKLINMLDEVEQRYRQYNHQMQAVISAFEQAAGMGSATTYTALALQTISKQFRSLKDAIAGQIKAANKSLGEEETPRKMEGSRLKFVDHHLRQQRALQQIGMMQHNAWRPQRGLPERSVSVLRAWLFEHFLHPYPKDSDKHMLAKQTGLTRSQVSNWFINARVRLWKPMVEEMYVEEMKDKDLQNGSGDQNTGNFDQNEDSSPKSAPFHDTNSSIDNQAMNCSPNQNVPTGFAISTQPFSLTASSELEGITQGSPKKPRNHHTDLLPSPASNSIEFVDERQSRDGYSFMGGQTNFMGAFGQYPIAEIGARFDPDQFAQRFSGNGVSLSLGLPHCENLNLSGNHHTFLPNHNIQLGRRLDMGEANEFGAMNGTAPHSSATYESINIQNRKGFAAQLLPDFVT